MATESRLSEQASGGALYSPLLNLDHRADPGMRSRLPTPHKAAESLP